MPYKDLLAIGTTSGLTLTDMETVWNNYTSRHRDWVQRGGQIVEEVVSGNSALPGNVISSLAKSDDQELLFVGTDKGLAILHGNDWLDTKTLLPDLPGVAITGLAWLNGDLWAATAEGIYQVKKASGLIPEKKAP